MSRSEVQEYGRIAMAYFPRRREGMIKALEQEEKRGLEAEKTFFKGLARRNVENADISRMALETVEMLNRETESREKPKNKGRWDSAMRGDEL